MSAGAQGVRDVGLGVRVSLLSAGAKIGTSGLGLGLRDLGLGFRVSLLPTDVCLSAPRGQVFCRSTAVRRDPSANLQL